MAFDYLSHLGLPFRPAAGADPSSQRPMSCHSGHTTWPLLSTHLYSFYVQQAGECDIRFFSFPFYCVCYLFTYSNEEGGEWAHA